MGLRVPIRAERALGRIVTIALTLVACNPTNPERCSDLLAVTEAQVLALARGCEADAECTPLAAACGKPAAVLKTADTAEATRFLTRYEDLCGCDGTSTRLAPAVCVSRICLPSFTQPSPEVCQELAQEMLHSIDRQNRCRIDADCTTFNVLTCPPTCGRPTARTADPGTVASLLLEYNRTPGCSECDPSCAAPPRTSCVHGLCASDVSLPRSCAGIQSELSRLVAVAPCERYADCAYIDYQGFPINGDCGRPASRDVAPRVAQLAEAYHDRCCPGCEVTCTERLPIELARCQSGRCIRASDCFKRFADAPDGWAIEYRAHSGEPTEWVLVVRDDGFVSATPPGVDSTATPEELAELVARADAAALLCLDDSFHQNGAIAIELSVSAPSLGFVTLRFAAADPLPSRLFELMATLSQIWLRLGGP